MACYTPVMIRDANKVVLPVPCGKCHHCRLSRVRAWIFRIEEESKHHVNAHFVTLTYATPPKTPKGLPTLRESDVQKFFKRLRFHSEKAGFSIKYYYAGEYGSTTFRPHYHAIILGNLTQADISSAWCGKVSLEDGVVLGHVHFGNVTPNSIAYTVKYIDKGKMIPVFKGDDRVPEFSRMSKGMGSRYLTPEMVAFHRRTNHPFVWTRGQKSPMPRYMKDKVFGKVFENGLLVADFTHLKHEANAEFRKKKEEQYWKHVKKHGSEERYIQNLNASLWAHKQNQLLQNKLKRNKI